MEIQRLFLSKLRIIILLSITGIVAYFIPSLDDINVIELIVFLLAGVISADGALIVNYFIDRDIDILMERTKNRASVGEEAIAPNKVLITGLITTAIGILIGFLYFGKWTMFHLAWGSIFYIIGYSIILKRKNISNTIIGGLASPAPVWAGYAARFEILGKTGDFLGVPLEGWLLGGLVFIWTPSHTWALSAKNVDDYAAANLPMVPVIYGIQKTGIWTFYWGLGVIAYGIWLSWWISHVFWLPILVAIVSIYLFYGLWIFKKDASKETAWKCFMIHNQWLSVVFFSILITKWIL